jgi:Toxin SymE, type I toxin-antitoxin system
MASRELRVGQTFQTRGHEEVAVPFIRLSGRWLEQAGFTSGTRVEVRVKSGKLLLVRRDSADQK